MKKAVIALEDLQDLLKNKRKYKLDEALGHQGVPDDYEGRQGEYNETFVFYSHPGLPEGIFMKETYHTDSYGDGNALENIEFVTGVKKKVTVYEPI